ncbi:MAG TPA: DUF998 domain-containing protein [Thermoplasmata archaeon]|nr:DUF998 domain-containing protein [Thermoplasmata archaeon]
MPDHTPLVHRAVRTGGIALAVASVQFVAAMIVVQSRYPHYSLSANYISDLGGASSPWALVFDASVIFLGAATLVAVLLIASAFDDRPIRSAGLGILLAAALGAIGVGVFPETTHVLDGNAHEIATAIAFVGAAVGFLVLSGAMRDGAHWRLSRPYTIVSGLVAGVATILFFFGVYLGLGPGGMERLVVAPILLWMIVEGIHIARLPRFAPGLSLPGTSG